MNKYIAELAEALADNPNHTRESIIQSMELAYAAGKCDSALEICGRFMKTEGNA